MPRRYLTPDEAAQLLGWEGARRDEKLLRIMFAKERKLGRDIMVRRGGAGRGTRYGLTEAMLHRYCSELFLATHDELLSEVRHQLGTINKSAVDRVLAVLVPELKGIEKRFERRIAALERARR
jgi:hypothetical protein